MTRFILLFLLLLYLIPESKAGYDVNDNCKKAWLLLMDLKIKEAKKLLADEIKINPQNYYVYYLDQICDYYKLLINSSEADYEKFVDDFYAKRGIFLVK